MRMEIESKDEGKGLFKARRLMVALDSALDEQERRAVIGLRWKLRHGFQRGLDERLEQTDFHSTCYLLREFRLTSLNENQIRRSYIKVKRIVDDVLRDHESWAYLTVLCVCEIQDYSEDYIEATIFENGEVVNNVPIDLIGLLDNEYQLVSCKFKLSSQHEKAKERLRELNGIVEEISEDAITVQGTFSFQDPEHLQKDLDDEFDVLLRGFDLLEAFN